MNMAAVTQAIRHLVADTEIKLNTDEDADRQYLLEDLMLRLERMADRLDDRVPRVTRTPAYPMRSLDEIAQALREF